VALDLRLGGTFEWRVRLVTTSIHTSSQVFEEIRKLNSGCFESVHKSGIIR
jgi:hypothetical protein